MYLEFEKKGLLTKSEYDAILKNNDVVGEIIQTNYYFETSDNYFKNNNSALRVRLTDNHCELTLKIRNNLSNIEYNHEIDDHLFFDMINNLKMPEIMNRYIDSDVVLDSVIKMVTKRSIIIYNGSKIEIDKTDFGNIIDYEVEVEGKNMKEASNVFDEFFKI